VTKYVLEYSSIAPIATVDDTDDVCYDADVLTHSHSLSHSHSPPIPNFPLRQQALKSRGGMTDDRGPIANKPW
jgi:hypothetical protein